MSEEINKILDKFDRTLEKYELDKKVGQPSIDSIYFLYPSEMITIKNYIRQKENIIKEVREKVEELAKLYDDNYTVSDKAKDILELIKENKQ